MTDRNKLKCPECLGNKVIMGAGYMEHKCPTCNGNGWVFESPMVKTIEPKVIDTQEMEVIEPIKAPIIKRRGRPAKVK